MYSYHSDLLVAKLELCAMPVTVLLPPWCLPHQSAKYLLGATNTPVDIRLFLRVDMLIIVV